MRGCCNYGMGRSGHGIPMVPSYLISILSYQKYGEIPVESETLKLQRVGWK